MLMETCFRIQKGSIRIFQQKSKDYYSKTLLNTAYLLLKKYSMEEFLVRVEARKLR